MVSDSRYPIWGKQMFLQASPGSFMQHHLRIFTYLFKVPFVFKLQGKQGSRCSLPTSCLALDMLGACLSCFLPCCDKNLTEPTSGRGFFWLPIQNHSSSCQGKARQPKWLVQWWQDLVLWFVTSWWIRKQGAHIGSPASLESSSSTSGSISLS